MALVKKSDLHFYWNSEYAQSLVGLLCTETYSPLDHSFPSSLRQGIPALKPAPIVASYLGYPGTVGAEFNDYTIADKVGSSIIQSQTHNSRADSWFRANNTRTSINPLGELSSSYIYIGFGQLSSSVPTCAIDQTSDGLTAGVGRDRLLREAGVSPR